MKSSSHTTLLWLLLILCWIDPSSSQTVAPMTKPPTTTNNPAAGTPKTSPPVVVTRAPVINSSAPLLSRVPVTRGPTATARAPVIITSTPTGTTYIPSSMYPTSLAPTAALTTTLPSYDIDSQPTDPPLPTLEPLPTTSAPVFTMAPTIAATRPPTIAVPALTVVECPESSPCVINLSPYTTHKCGYLEFHYNIVSSGAAPPGSSNASPCCALQDATNGTCTVTVSGASCSISHRLDKQCFAYGKKDTRAPAFYCKESNSLLVEWSVKGILGNVVHATPNASTCPASLYGRIPAGKTTEVPLSTMLFNGAMGIVPYINLNIWAEITTNHILAYYNMSSTVQDLLVSIQPFPQPEETNTTRGNAVVSYHLYAAYRGTGPFLLNDLFNNETKVEPYLAAMREYGGLIFTNLTGVHNTIMEDTIVQDAPTTAPVLPPLSAVVPTPVVSSPVVPTPVVLSPNSSSAGDEPLSVSVSASRHQRSIKDLLLTSLGLSLVVLIW